AKNDTSVRHSIRLEPKLRLRIDTCDRLAAIRPTGASTMALSQLFSRRARLVLTLLVAGGVPAASGDRLQESEAEAAAAAAAAVRADGSSGRLLVLPGVYNTRFQLDGFVERAEARLPRFDIEVRRWGTPLLPLRNLRAHERNLVTAQALAAEIAE